MSYKRFIKEPLRASAADLAVPAPSDEAVEAAILTASNPVHDDGHTDTYYAGLLAAAYAIDMPRREAEVRAETLREVEQPCRARIAASFRDWIHGTVLSQCDRGVDTCPDWPLAYELADMALAHFNPEAE